MAVRRCLPSWRRSNVSSRAFRRTAFPLPPRSGKFTPSIFWRRISTRSISWSIGKAAGGRASLRRRSDARLSPWTADCSDAASWCRLRRDSRHPRSSLRRGQSGTIEPHVAALREAVRRGGYDAGFAADGDGDRIGAVDPDGTFVNPHQIFSIFFWHLAGTRQLSGDLAKTFSTTKLLDKSRPDSAARLSSYRVQIHLRADA